jgi:hypothetical protein
MNHINGDDPNIHHEPSDLLPAEILKMINELLEQLHELHNSKIKKFKKEKIEKLENSGKLNNEKIIKLEKEGIEDEKIEREKSVQINIYEKGSQHIDTQINWKASPPAQASPPAPLAGERGVDSFETTKGLPEVLATEEAMRLWEKGRQAGYVDECYQPLISRTQSALLADAMAERLGIKEKWKAFEELWHRKYMRNDYNLALTQRQSYKFQDDLKQLFG